jgi:hypothetical protein
MVFIYRKRTKKTAPRPGRKKAKKDQPPTDQGTPRTRAAVAREAAAKAAREAAKAADKAVAAAEQAERHLLDVPPLERIPPSSPRTPPRYDTTTFTILCLSKNATLNHMFEHRNTYLGLQVVNQIEDMPADGALRKMTPRRKQLASKVRKSPGKKTPAKKGKNK